MFLKVLGYQIGPAVEDGVRGIVTEVKKEGFVLVAFYEFDRFQIQTVGQVLVFAHPVFGKIEPTYGLRAEDVGPEVRSVAHALDFAPGVPVKSVVSGANFELSVLIFVAGQVPFADHAGGVAVPLENFREGNVAYGKSVGGIGTEVVENSHSGRVLAGQQGRPVGRAHGSGGIGVGEPDALLGKLVEVGRFVE